MAVRPGLPRRPRCTSRIPSQGAWRYWHVRRRSFAAAIVARHDRASVPSPFARGSAVRCRAVKRRLFNLLAAVSLVLLVTTSMLWVLSFPAIHQMSEGWPCLHFGSVQTRFYSSGVDRGEFKFAVINKAFFLRPLEKNTVDLSVETPIFWIYRAHETAAPAQWAAWLNVQCWVICVLAAI